MAEVTSEQRFHGTVALVVLHLRRLAQSNDTDKGFAAARELLMIDAEQERFMRECMELDGALQSGDVVCDPNTGAVIDDEAFADRIKRLQTCIFSINSADPA